MITWDILYLSLMTDPVLSSVPNMPVVMRVRFLSMIIMVPTGINLVVLFLGAMMTGGSAIL